MATEAAGAAHVAIGRLYFEDWKPGIARQPLHHFEVELWERGLLGHGRCLAAGMSDLSGAFALPFTPGAGHRGLELRLVEVHRAFAQDGERVETRHLLHVVDLPPPPASGWGPTVDFGEIDLPYWPYTYAGPLPRVLIPPGAEPPQDYPRGRKVALVKTLAELGLARARHHLENELNPHLPHLDTVQRDYPENTTLRLEREQPGVTRSDAYFADRIFNGFNPCLAVGDARHPGELRVGFNWDSCEMDGEHTLPNADAWFELRDGQPVPVRIGLQRRLLPGLAPGSPMEPWAYYTPADGESWRRAQRLYRCAWSLHGQIVAHLTKAHLNVEQYAIAAYRNLRANPLRDLLFPHLKDVAIINHGGTNLIFGERGFVTVASALTCRAIDQRFVETLGGLDWQDWRPRAPLYAGHVYALAANLYWDVLTRHVEGFLAEHEAAIRAHWAEVRLFSADLVAHAVPYVAPSVAEYDLLPEASELGDREGPRAVVNGVTKAVRPLTHTDSPGPGELADLAQLCRYVIFHATFYHAWANDRQHDDGGELRFNALSLRNGGWGPEDDDTIAQAPRVASDQIFFAMYLQYTRYGYLLKNEDGDVPRRFVELLGEQAEAFRAIGFDPATIRACINI